MASKVRGKPQKKGRPASGPKPVVKSIPRGEVLDFPGLPALAQYVRQGRCALFVGAGLSVGAGLPTWAELMRRLIPAATPFGVPAATLTALERFRARYHATHEKGDYPRQSLTLRHFRKALSQEGCERLFAPPDGTGSLFLADYNSFDLALERVRRDTAVMQELEKLLQAGRFPELAGYCRDLLGRERFHDLVRQELQVRGDVPATHRAIVRTPYACIVTTNFDTLLEDAYALHDPRGLPKTPAGFELAQQGTLLLDDAFFILKAHGDVDDEASIVFTTDDYRRVIHSSPAFQAMMTSLLLNHAVLFVGYSLSDTNFRLLLDNQLTIFNENVPPRYALMHDIGAAEREILWQTARLGVFSYPRGRHEVVERFLTALADRAAADRPGPATVAAGTSPANAMRRKTLGRPQPVRTVTLGVRALGERLTLDLWEEMPGQPRQRAWSGGCQWPDWHVLRHAFRGNWDWSRLELTHASAVGSQLREVIPGELLQRLDDLPLDVVVALALSPETEVLPWEWLIVQGSPLCLRNPAVRRPVGISDKARGLRFVGTPLRALIVGDAGMGDEGRTRGSLPGATAEAEGVAEVLRDDNPENVVTVLERDHAVYERLVHEVETGDYDVIHFAGHAHIEETESVLMVWDGRVSSSELASLLNRRPPALLVLNSHNTAFVLGGMVTASDRTQDERPPGIDRPMPPAGGFTGLASRSGVGAFVGCFGLIMDDPAAAFATGFYKQLLAGRTFASALHQARRAATTFNDITGLFYAGSGCPHLRLTAGGPGTR